MGNPKKGDLVRFTKWAKRALDPGRKDTNFGPAFLENEVLNQVHTISSFNRDTTVFLEGHGEVPYQNFWFERVCCICQKEEVFKQMRKFDKCLHCAREYRGEMYEKMKAVLTPEQLDLFDKYYKSEGDFRSMMMLD